MKQMQILKLVALIGAGAIAILVRSRANTSDVGGDTGTDRIPDDT